MLIALEPTHAAEKLKKKPLLECDIEFATIGRKSRLTAKSDLLAAYLHRKFTTPIENQKWIQLAQDSKPSSGLLFGDIEFSVLQKVNTLTNDKNFVTSLTNKHKELTFKALDALQQKHSDQFDIIAYSDFKSVRFTIVPKNMRLPPKLEHEVKTELALIFEQINSDYVKFVRSHKMDVDAQVEKWFRGGIGVTADEANFATRMSRDMGPENLLRDFEDPGIRRAMAVYQRWAESMRQVDIVADESLRHLIDGGFVKDDVLDILKKTPDSGGARARLKSKYDADLSESQIDRLILYSEIVDNFSPGIHVSERNVASLERAEFGGLSADFSGLGAKNRGATARALASGRDLREAIAHARKNEQLVTKEFAAEAQAFKSVIDRYLTSTVSSGDDFVGLAPSPLNRRTKQRIVSDVAKLKNPSAQRLSFISPGTEATERNVVAAHGEAIEKLLRQELEGQLGTEKLQQVVFAVDMLGKSVGRGDVELMVGEGPLAKLTAAERRKIQKSFHRAVRAFNEPTRGEEKAKTYRPRS